MRLQPWIKQRWLLVIILLFISLTAMAGEEDISADRLSLVAQQIDLLKSRDDQMKKEYARLQSQRDIALSTDQIDKSSKTLLEKASLEISVSNSALQSIGIELADTRQTINWLEKNIQDISNQLNVESIFGAKVASSEISHTQDLKDQLIYQQKLLDLEKSRLKLLETLQVTVGNVLQLNKENLSRLNLFLKSHKLLHINQQEVQDELVFQRQQNAWLKQVNDLYAKIATINPVTHKANYTAIERDIFYANENANLAYVRSLTARYKDQIQQIKIANGKNNSISLLNEMSDQMQLIGKQIDQLTQMLKTRMAVLKNHISYLSPRKTSDASIAQYITKLSDLTIQYDQALLLLKNLDKDVSVLRGRIDQSLQTELSQRQGFPTFSAKMLLDLGREILLVPALTFQIVKSASTQLIKMIQSAGFMLWFSLSMIEFIFIAGYIYSKKYIHRLLIAPSGWREQLNMKWISLLWISRNLLDLFVIANLIIVFYLAKIPMQSLLLMIYLSMVWFIFKTVLLLGKLCFSARLYRYARWLILVAGFVTGLTVFVHALPLVYELKALCDRLFLLFTLILSIILMRSWKTLPDFILSKLDVTHPYIERSVRLISFFIPFLIFINSLLGLMGFLNFVMTITWYEGIFLLVFVVYLAIRGLLSEASNFAIRLVMDYTQNGWLWSEAFIKPIHRVLNIFFFLLAGALLFVLYGWDNESPIVERFSRLLHHKVFMVLNTPINILNMIELVVVISVFYWITKWSREFMYRLLASRTRDMGIRNSLAVLTQYAVVVLGVFFCLRVLGIDFRALAVVGGMFALGVGLGLKDLINNFACGFLILLERPLRVGDIVNVNGVEGEVANIGSRAITIVTWDRMEMLVPNTEIFNKTFINWTGRDNLVRSTFRIQISRYDNPHLVEKIIYDVLGKQKELQKDPPPKVYLSEMNDSLMSFDVRYFINVRKVESRSGVLSTILTNIWDAFNEHGIKPPASQQEIIIRRDLPAQPG